MEQKTVFTMKSKNLFVTMIENPLGEAGISFTVDSMAENLLYKYSRRGPHVNFKWAFDRNGSKLAEKITQGQLREPLLSELKEILNRFAEHIN